MSAPARCTCGSGGHPRECATHPEEYARHVAELDAEWSVNADMTPLARPSPAWSVAIDPNTPLVAPAKPFIPPSMLEPDDDAPEPPA